MTIQSIGTALKGKKKEVVSQSTTDATKNSEDSLKKQDESSDVAKSVADSVEQSDFMSQGGADFVSMLKKDLAHKEEESKKDNEMLEAIAKAKGQKALSKLNKTASQSSASGSHGSGVISGGGGVKDNNIAV